MSIPIRLTVRSNTTVRNTKETGNYYYGARYYDPKWSIFISVDPLAEETGDAYGYCYQNPINLTDPTGMSAEGDGLSPIFDNKTGAFLGIDDKGWYEDDVLFMPISLKN